MVEVIRYLLRKSLAEERLSSSGRAGRGRMCGRVPRESVLPRQNSLQDFDRASLCSPTGIARRLERRPRMYCSVLSGKGEVIVQCKNLQCESRVPNRVTCEAPCLNQFNCLLCLRAEVTTPISCMHRS